MSKLFIDKKGQKVPVAELELILSKEQLVLGNLERDVILRTAGNIKIQVGNKFYDLPFTTTDYQGGDSGIVVTGSKVVILDNVSSLNTITYPGDGSFVYTRDTQGFYLAVGSTYIQLNTKDDSSKIYLSFSESQELTGEQKYTLAVNAGNIVESINDVANLTSDEVYTGQVITSRADGKLYQLIDKDNSTLVESWRELFLSLTTGGTISGDVYLSASKLHFNSLFAEDYLTVEKEEFDGLFIGEDNYTEGLAIWRTNNNVIFSNQKNDASGFKFITHGSLADYNTPLSISNNNVGIGGPVDYSYSLTVTGNSLFKNKAYYPSGLRSPDFFSALNGTGWDISVDGLGKYTLEIDKLILRDSPSTPGNRFISKGLDGSIIFNHSCSILRADLIETIEVEIAGSAAGRYSDNIGTVMPLSSKTRWVEVDRIPVANLYNEGAVKTTSLMELAFGIGDLTSGGTSVGYTTYAKQPDNSYAVISGTVVADTISVYEVQTNTAVSSFTVGDLLFFKEWDANKLEYKSIFAEVVALDASTIVVYCYNNSTLRGGDTLIKIGNTISQESYVELNSSDKRNPFMLAADEVENFNDLITAYYIDPHEKETSTDREDIFLGKNQVRFKAGLLADIVDTSLGLTSTPQTGLYSDNAYIKGNFVGNRLMLGANLIWDGTTFVAPGYVPATRELTINGVTYDLSADRTWTISVGGPGTVTSVDFTPPTGFTVSGAPIITAGTIVLDYAAGYSLPTNASQADWDAAFSWGDHALAGYLTTESDPTVPSYAKSLTAFSVIKTNTDAIYYPLTGNPSGFLTSFSETDPTVPTYAKSLTSFSVIKSDTDTLYYPLSSNPAGYLTSFSETDPTVPTYAKSLTAFSVIKSSTDTLYYPLSANPAGYLTSFTESDPTVPSYAKSLTAFSVIKPDTDALYSVLAHTHTFASLTSKPTSLAGYGITDAIQNQNASPQTANFSINGHGIFTSGTNTVDLHGTGIVTTGSTGDFWTYLAPQQLLFRQTTTYTGTIAVTGLTASRTWYMPDGGGLVALDDDIESGTYTPTITNVSNITSSTANKAHYMRVKNEVTVFGRLAIAPTGAGAVEFRISLPISSNLGNANDLSGLGQTYSTIGDSIVITGDVTNNVADVVFSAPSGSVLAGTMTFSFMYTII